MPCKFYFLKTSFLQLGGDCVYVRQNSKEDFMYENGPLKQPRLDGVVIVDSNHDIIDGKKATENGRIFEQLNGTVDATFRTLLSAQEMSQGY